MTNAERRKALKEQKAEAFAEARRTGKKVFKVEGIYTQPGKGITTYCYYEAR